jgi:hypothetical protein
MIKHIVLWKLKDFAEGATRDKNLQRMQGLLEALPGLISEIKSFEVGQVLETEKDGYDLALYSAFDSPEGLRRYIEHPEHQKVVKFVRAVTAQRAVADYEV